jgi:ferredoxin-type protein NapG
MSDQQPVNRRGFFRESLRELLRPIAAAVEPIELAARQLSELDRPAPPKPKTFNLLRPPGALDEEDFTQTCTRSGECIHVCPAKCIQLDPTNKRGGGAAFIDADHMPCVVCDGLYCMQACPSGALVPTPLVEIDMGTAVWNEQTCVRSFGQECMICVEKCPLGTAAIELRAGKINVIESGCIGCGVCQHECPTSPKSIVVTPRHVRADHLVD